MDSLKNSNVRWTLGISAAVLLAGAIAWIASPAVRDWTEGLFTRKAAAANEAPKAGPAELLTAADGSLGLRLTKDALASMDLRPIEIARAVAEHPLPPQIGTVNYDNEHLFPLRPRFAGEIVELGTVPIAGDPKERRPIRFGDRVKQDDTLAVVWSRDLGEKKAALVDAISARNLSEIQEARQKKLLLEGGYPENVYLATLRQLQADSGAVLTAERTLRMWKLSDPEIKAITDEAKTIIDLKKKRDPNVEKDWARAVIKVPKYTDDPKRERELVIVEKNTQVGEMVDPARDTPLFRLADLSRLQIWVHPPEEYLPFLRERVETKALKWHIRFKADSPKDPPLELDVALISPSLEPNQHTPMLIGYLDNPKREHLIGQFVTATIFVKPPKDTVEVRTDAINPVNGQQFVFVENPKAKDEFFIRRVYVVQSYKKVSLVRIEPTAAEDLISAQEVKKGRFPIRGLKPGERVITRGVVELTAALEELRSAKEQAKQ